MAFGLALAHLCQRLSTPSFRILLMANYSHFMKKLLLPFLLLAANTFAFGQTKSAPRLMAKPGEEVWVWAYPVKADKRKQYEHFVHDIFWPGARKLSAVEQRVFRQTRVMHPAQASPDGSYTYLFIMDPLIKGADYDIESLTKKMYGPKQGADYLKLFGGALAGKNIGYRVTQSKD